MDLLKFALYFLFSVLLLSACISEPESVVVDNLDKEINVKLSQNPTINGPELNFDLSSVDQFDCTDSYILSKLEVNGELLTLSIDEIHVPDHCSAGDLPANGNARLALTEGIYQMEIQLGENSFDIGTLISDQNSFFLSSFLEAAGLSISNSSIHKIPDNHVWGTIEIPDATSAIWTEFLNNAGPYISKSNEIEIGDYGIFQVESLNEPINFNGSELFIFYEVHDLQGLMDFLNDFRNQFPEVIIDLVHSTGVVL